MKVSSVSVIRSSIQQSSSNGTNIFTLAENSNVDTKILQHTSTASTTSNVGAVTTTPTTQSIILVEPQVLLAKPLLVYR